VRELTINQRRAVSRVTAREYQAQPRVCRMVAAALGKKVWVWVDGQPLRLVVGARRKRCVAPRPRTYCPSLIEPLKKVWYLFD
jgi:hypothetical protein